MPKLSDLELRNAVPEFLPQPTPRRRLINLSALRVLSFFGDYMHCLSLLQNLTLPLSLIVRLRLVPRDISQTPYADVFHEVARYLQSSIAHMKPIRRLSITGSAWDEDDTYLEFLAEIPFESSPRAPRTYFKLEFYLEDSGNSWDDFGIIHKYCLVMPLQAVRKLELHIPVLPFGSLDYINLFSPMRDLAFLSISGQLAVELPVVLNMDIASQRNATPDHDSNDPWGAMSSAGPRDWMFPKLISLRFSSYNFRDVAGPSFVVALQQALEHRRLKLGHKPLKRLTFDQCFFADDEWVSGVSECVEKLSYPENFLDPEYAEEFRMLEFDAGE